jgi:hypothetical protein
VRHPIIVTQKVQALKTDSRVQALESGIVRARTGASHGRGHGHHVHLILVRLTRQDD